MPRLITPDDPDFPLEVSREQALALGHTESSVRHRVNAGLWTTVAPGRYVTATATEALPRFVAERVRHERRAIAAAARRPGAVVGYASAAVVHGLPLVSAPPREVHLLVAEGGWTGIRAGVRSRLAALQDEDVVLAGVRWGEPVSVTSVARTWVDLARTLPLSDALSAGDHALRAGLVTRDALGGVLDRLGPVRGCRRARFALGHLDERRESPLESGSAAHFILWKFPVPRLQHTFYDVGGAIARSDFDWPDHRVIGFADGLGKYGIDPRRDRWERRQEARLRPHGVVARWGWPDAEGRGVGLFMIVAPLLGFTGPLPR